MNFLHSSNIFIICLIIWSTVKEGYTGVPLSRIDYSDLGLYNASDKVVSLTSTNVKSYISNQKYGTVLEFYNSFCGHCRRFAPKYKKLAEDIYSWRKLIKVAAIDCAEDQNNDFCREFEVMAYPTIRYFAPFYVKDEEQANLGVQIKTQDVDEIKQVLIEYAAKETNRSDDNWPDFSVLSNNEDDATKLILSVPDNVKYVFVIYENENSTLASNLILDFSLFDTIRIRRTINADIAVRYNILTPNTIAIIDKNAKINNIHSIDMTENSFKFTIDKFLKEKNIIATYTSSSTTETTYLNSPREIGNYSSIIEHVKESGVHIVYKADLDHALYYTIFHEIPKFINLEGKRLLGLQSFINVISRYNPLGKNGEIFMNQLKEFVMVNNQRIDGREFEKYVKKLLEESKTPLFTTTDQWIGCLGSKTTYRGFSCGLWKLFHYLTVQAAENDNTTDPLEVLQAIYDYVKNFFGCTNCSQHFQRMAAKRKMWNTASKDDAVLWLWAAHNEVNNRLAGDETEDPNFPKHQFPSQESCSQCYSKDIPPSSIINEINWNKQEVLNFMKQIYNIQNISLYGVDNMNSAASMSHKMGSIFSDVDLSVGFILYGFCIIMMIFAVKLFMFRGYRKKSYPHNVFGKA